MPMPRFLAALPLVDRFTLPRYDAETLASLVAHGRVSSTRLAAQSDALGPVKRLEVLNATMGGVRPRFPEETLSSADEVAGERLRVRIAEGTLGESFTAQAVEHLTAEEALPFLRFGSQQSAVAAVHAINGHAGTRFGAPTDPDVIAQAAGAILDRGEEPGIATVRAIELARHVRSRALFEAVCTAVERSHLSQSPDEDVRAVRGEPVLVEMLTNPAVQPYGDGGLDLEARREKRARILDATISPSTVQTVWASSGRSPEEAETAVHALARIAGIANAHAQQHDDTRYPYLMCTALDVGSHVVSTLGSEQSRVLPTESVMALRDIAIALQSGGSGRPHASWKSASFVRKNRTYRDVATEFLAKTNALVPSTTVPDAFAERWQEHAARTAGAGSRTPTNVAASARASRVTDTVPAAAVLDEPFPVFRMTGPEVYEDEAIDESEIDAGDAGIGH